MSKDISFLDEDKREEEIINDIREESDVNKGAAIAIAKDNDLLAQHNDKLVLGPEAVDKDSKKSSEMTDAFSMEGL